ncbi:hypothetical protein GZH46_03007 [Fragariocoptes setiger]|uniref:Uncharacterized protein n=1 Tax=Fragariocoptes setiger TaxID=1670756 RepID=A0ABQ7S500_9ACAR|nr:hypothetical protein GZH46_03007 [Fragariocoptes setiger]
MTFCVSIIQYQQRYLWTLTREIVKNNPTLSNATNTNKTSTNRIRTSSKQFGHRSEQVT